MNRVIKQQDSDAARDAGRSGWSAYFDRLGRQVKKTANTTIWSGEPVRPANESQMPQRRARHSSGDRRMTVDQRRQLLAGKPAAFATPRPDLPFFNRYLAQLGASKQERTEPAVRPIGDRRTGQRRNREEPVRGKWFPRVREKLRSLFPQEEVGAVSPGKISLGVWGYYFVAKLALYGMGAIAFHSFENLVFVAFVLLRTSSRLFTRLKMIVGAVLAISLLYYDSWLPPVGRLLTQASLLSTFSLPYLLELSGRFISWKMTGLLLAAMLCYWVAQRLMRVGVLVVLGMLVLLVVQYFPSGERASDFNQAELEHVYQEFFSKEAQRSVLFVSPQADAPPFDVIFIHVCSLSWDDIQAVGLENHPLWQRFDILFKKFNSVSSYSGPAALHLMRAKCGQPRHGQMYGPVADKCYLMGSLQLSGFTPELAMNHDGKFDDFLGQLEKHGRLTATPLNLEGVDIAQRAFDGSPVYDDLAVLTRWLHERKTSDSMRVALYYNTVSMHDGNHRPDLPSEPNTPEAYRARLLKFLDETEVFLKKLETSGRRAVVVMVPEHGAALRGDKRQISGLREIPTPLITLVPVGIKVIGSNREGEALMVEQPSSYLAISHIVERMLERSPYNRFVPSDYVEGLPVTDFVSQSESMTVIESDGKYYLGRDDGKWERYAEFDQATPAR